MRSQFLRGALVGGLSAAVVMVASGALAGTGIGSVFNLGKTNTVNARSALIGSTSGAELQVVNTSTGNPAHAINASSKGGGATIRAQNSGPGPAAAFSVPPGQPPFAVDSSTEVAGLNAEQLQGKTPADFYAAGSTVANSDQLGGVPPSGYYAAGSTVANSNALGGVAASGYQRRCQRGGVFALARVEAASNFSTTFVQLTNVPNGGDQTVFNCSGDKVFAKRVGTGDYRVLVCGIPLPNSELEPFALVTDESFNDFAGVNLMEPPDSDVQQTCGSFDTFSEFKVTTRDSGGVARDRPFVVAQL